MYLKYLLLPRPPNNQPLKPQNETSQCLSTFLGESETPISIRYYMAALNKHVSLY